MYHLSNTSPTVYFFQEEDSRWGGLFCVLSLNPFSTEEFPNSSLENKNFPRK